jgi:uncharacterized phage protein (TIGR02220 family)
MKYTIEGFSQKRLVELGLDTVDACILRWFVDFSHTDKMVKFIRSGLSDGVPFLWVNYQAVIDDLPILGITNREVIARRFKKMESCGLLEVYIKKADTGSFSCFRLISSIYEALIMAPDSKVGWPPDSKVDPKDSSSNINSSTNSLNTYCPVETRKEIIHYLNKTTMSNFKDSTASTIKHINARWKEGFKLEDFIAVINWKSEQWLRDDKFFQYLRPETLFGTKFESYLNAIPPSQREEYRSMA